MTEKRVKNYPRSFFIVSTVERNNIVIPVGAEQIERAKPNHRDRQKLLFYFFFSFYSGKKFSNSLALPSTQFIHNSFLSYAFVNLKGYSHKKQWCDIEKITYYRRIAAVRERV